MSKRFREVVDQYLMKEGPAGKAVLAAAAGKHPATIDRWIKNGCPTPHDAYMIALACGRSEQEAQILANEESAARVKRTA
jgi:hypothetical protein